MNIMNKELLKRWVAALRSGEYKQGTEALCEYGEDGSAAYCCLGVLQNIEPGIEQEDNGEELLDEVSLRQFLGVNDDDGFYQRQYAKLNDGGMPFAEIADRLENLWLNNEENKS